ncbi:ethanolamine utilization protein EutJ [Atopobium fossor]|uniref:ethanolamine utilization protein EutJ n=1 Tax=Atopobium fossor TaxID=39487 RepID=UPI0004040751|nr:ethanolamine utilization protein EutJ [Atopobium fossor]
MINITCANKLLDALIKTVDAPKPVKTDELYCGLDLGTAFIVLTVINGNGDPVACAYQFANVVRDGLVVDYVGACDIAATLKKNLEKVLGTELIHCAVAIPPGTEQLDGGAVKNVAESTGMNVVAVFDEPTAANLVINTQDGAVVDIGGGTTGISIFEHGKLVECIDESTGGTHFSLVLAGAKNMSFNDAELYKRDAAHHAEVLPIVAPTVDKVSSIIRSACRNREVPEIILVGGTSELSGIEGHIEKTLNIPVHKPHHPMFVTPLGIALGCRLHMLEEANHA